MKEKLYEIWTPLLKDKYYFVKNYLSHTALLKTVSCIWKMCIFAVWF